MQKVYRIYRHRARIVPIELENENVSRFVEWQRTVDDCNYALVGNSIYRFDTECWNYECMIDDLGTDRVSARGDMPNQLWDISVFHCGPDGEADYSVDVIADYVSEDDSFGLLDALSKD